MSDDLLEDLKKTEAWEYHFKVKGYHEFRNFYWGVFCVHTGKRYGQGERSVGAAVRKARRVYKTVVEKAEKIILGGEDER
jgi:hypothetical protein